MSASNEDRQKKRKAESLTGEDADKAEQKVDVKYNDEGADLVIISSDGVRFYVKKYFVLAASIVFRSMIEACNSQPAEVLLTDNAIERSKIIELFLDLACGTYFPDFDAIPFGQIFDLINFCDKYDCTTPLQLLKLSVSRPLDPSSVNNIYRFFMACTLDDAETAYRTLPSAASKVWAGVPNPGPEDAIPDASSVDMTSMSAGWRDRLPRKYFLALLRANRLRLTDPKGTWQEVADDFKEQIRLYEVKHAKKSSPSG